MKTLPDSLQKLSRAQLKKVVDEKATERTAIQKEIATVNIQRENYIAAEKAKAANKNNTATLETEVEVIIRAQAKRFNMTIQ